MKTQRGHSAGVNIRTVTGKIITGPQPRQAEICWANFVATMSSIVVGARLYNAIKKLMNLHLISVEHTGLSRSSRNQSGRSALRASFFFRST